MKKVHKVATNSATWIPTQWSVQGSVLSALVVCRMFRHCGCILASIRCILVWIICSICSLQLKKWISWLLTHYSHLYIFAALLLEKKRTKNSGNIATYTHYILNKFQLNPFIIVRKMDSPIVSSLFSFLYLSSSITLKVTNEKFWKNYRLFATYTNYIISKFQLDLFSITELINFFMKFLAATTSQRIFSKLWISHSQI